MVFTGTCGYVLGMLGTLQGFRSPLSSLGRCQNAVGLMGLGFESASD